ncbi:hypothetical protein BJ912DRAFT_945110 [Pholiota molesta]|nr:hypothetical protein BJ912DRAFT_945110 [Pholiota molesta]
MTAVKLLTAVRLPLDILWEVIAFLWHSPMSPGERIDFIFCPTSYTDVYITSRPHLDYYLKILRQESHIYKCYKAFPISSANPLPFKSSPRIRQQKSLLMFIYGEGHSYPSQCKHTRPPIPRNFCYWDIYRHQFIDLPSRIERLESSGEPLGWYIPNPTWQLSQVRYLSIFGTQGHEIILWCFLVACPQLYTLETEFSIEDLKPKVHGLIKLPSTILSSRHHH